MPSPLLAIAAAVLLVSPAMAQTPLVPREAPAKSIRVPSDVSPAMQAIIAQPLRTNWDKPPITPEAWKQYADSIATAVAPLFPPWRNACM